MVADLIMSPSVTDFSTFMASAITQQADRNYKRVALYLSILSKSDRKWLMKHLLPQDRDKMNGFLQEIKTSGLRVDQSLGKQLLNDKPMDASAEAMDFIKRAFLEEDIPCMAISMLTLENPNLETVNLGSANKKAFLELYLHGKKMMPQNLIDSIHSNITSLSE